MAEIQGSPKTIEIPKGEKILFVCAHPDDETFAAGAFLSRLSREGNNITCVYFTSSPGGVIREIPIGKKIALRKREAEKACQILGAKPLFLDFDKPHLNECLDQCAEVETVFSKIKPTIVFMPSKEEAHPTHRMTAEVTSGAMKNLKDELIVKLIFEYEVWTPLKNPNFIYFFEEDEVEIKVKAFENYQSQLERVDFIDAMIGLSLYRGIMGEELISGFGKLLRTGKRYGEAFLVNFIPHTF